jgi:FKBP-type peptidyl-prolyl cis-trans isomerase
MKRLVLSVLTLLAVASCGGDDDNGPGLSPTTSAPYSQTDLVVGTGALASPGNTLTVAYTGWLHDSSRADAKGRQFDTGTYQFRLGAGAVIRGWDVGVAGMRVGGQRRLVIPPDLAYGNQSPPGSIIPPNATLVFDVTLNNVQ